jgi:hypothetical protein
MFVVIAAISAFAFAFLMVRLAERSSGVATKRGHLMRHHSFSIGVGVCFSCGALLLFAFLLGSEGNREPIALRNGVMAFSLVIGPATWFTYHACRTSLLLFPKGLWRLAPGIRRRVLWAEVESVSFDAFAARYRITARNGLSIVVSQFMTGQREFAVGVLRSVPAAKLNCETQLEKLAAD